jgi:hypothetical protein
MELLKSLKNWLSNSKPSKEELAKRLEQEHKTLFLYLVDATNYWYNLSKKLPKKTRTAAQSKILADYLAKGLKAASVWNAQQKQLETVGVPKYAPKFFDPLTLPDLNARAQKIRSGLAGAESENLGLPVFVVPLIWFGVVTVAGWASTKIVDMLTTTTQEQEQLMLATKQTALELGLNPDQSAALLTENAKGVDSDLFGGGGSIILYLGIAAVLYFGLMSNKK